MGNLVSSVGVVWNGLWRNWRLPLTPIIQDGNGDQNQGQNNRLLVAVYLVKIRDVKQSLKDHPEHPMNHIGQVRLEPHQVYRIYIFVDTYWRIFGEYPRPNRIRTLAFHHCL